MLGAAGKSSPIAEPAAQAETRRTTMQSKISFVRIAFLTLCTASIALSSVPAAQAGDEDQAFIPNVIVSSTIPANGDLNPSGVAFVPDGFPAAGTIAPGDVLVANFNA